MIKFQCPFCEQPIEAEDEHYRTVVACPTCEKEFGVPEDTLLSDPPSSMPKEEPSDLTTLVCDNNQLTELDLSPFPNLTRLACNDNQLTELDIRPVSRLYRLSYGEGKTRLIQHPDQNFYAYY